MVALSSQPPSRREESQPLALPLKPNVRGLPRRLGKHSPPDLSRTTATMWWSLTICRGQATDAGAYNWGRKRSLA